jgi:CheY-like chemotaxis protein
VVDDDQAVRETVSEILSESGYDCILAPDGLSAVKLFTEEPGPIHLVILDWAMAGLDGADTYRRLREINPQVKAVLMSGYQRSEEIETLVSEGVKAFVSKPFQIDKLIRTVYQALEE